VIITKIETFPLRIPAWGDKNLQVADSLLVKVTTDQGLDGWGETFGFRAVTSAKLAIDELIAPLCVGQDATQIASLMLEVQKKLHVFGRGGPLIMASPQWISPCGISQARPRTRRSTDFSVAAVPISPVTQVWSVTLMLHLFAPMFGGRSTMDFAV
jgi:hypothetical protein